MRTVAVLILLASSAPLLPAAAEAQSAWDGPSLVSPWAPQGLSLLLLAQDPGGSVGAMAHYRKDTASLGLAYRAGVVQDDQDDASVFAGVDVAGILARSVEDADIQVQWWSGVGAAVGREWVVSIPAGLVAAWRGLGDGNVFAPYAGAHVVADLASGDGVDLSLDASLDLGLDLTLVSGWVVRFGASLFGREAVAVGVRIPS